jgi:hypothetical protein
MKLYLISLSIFEDICWSGRGTLFSPVRRSEPLNKNLSSPLSSPFPLLFRPFAPHFLCRHGQVMINPFVDSFGLYQRLFPVSQI